MTSGPCCGSPWNTGLQELAKPPASILEHIERIFLAKGGPEVHGRRRWQWPHIVYMLHLLRVHRAVVYPLASLVIQGVPLHILLVAVNARQEIMRGMIHLTHLSLAPH